MHNLYDLPEYQDVIKELKVELLRLQEQSTDPIRNKIQ